MRRPQGGMLRAELYGVVVELLVLVDMLPLVGAVQRRHRPFLSCSPTCRPGRHLSDTKIHFEKPTRFSCGCENIGVALTIRLSKLSLPQQHISYKTHPHDASRSHIGI
jgi:hypothetical protein